MAVSVVQSATQRASSATTVTATLSSVTAGNTIVAILFIDKNSGTINTPTSSGAGAFSVVQSNNQTSVSGGVAYKVAGGGETGITWTWTTSQIGNLWVAEVSGLTSSPYDVSAKSAGSETSVTSRSTGTTGTTAQADEWAIVASIIDSYQNGDGGRAWTNSFTEYTFVGTTANDAGGSIATKTLSATGTVESTYSTTDAGDQMIGFVAVFKIASTGYTLSCTAASFTLTGNASNLLRAERLVADVQSYAETGAVAGLRKASILSATIQSYALTGNAAGLSVKLNTESAAYVITGTATTFTRAVILSGTTQTYALTGNDVSFSIGKTLTAQTQSYTLTGQAAGLLASRTISAGTGAYTLTRNNVSFAIGKTLAAAVGSFVVTGNDAALKRALILAASQASYILTGNNANLSTAGSFTLTASTGTFVLTGNAAQLLKSSVLPVTVSAFAVGYKDAEFINAVILTVTAATYTLTGNNVTISTGGETYSIGGLVWADQRLDIYSADYLPETKRREVIRAEYRRSY